MARGKVLAIGLDGFEIGVANDLIDQGRLPAIAELRERSASVLLDHLVAGRTGLAWEHFWSGCSPEAAGRASAVEFDPTTYAVWQEGARFDPFFADFGARIVTFDACYADLTRVPEVHGVVAWGAHDPGLNTMLANPPGLLDELIQHVGTYPSAQWTYANPWPSARRTEAMGRGLVEGVETRAKAARWLLTERLPDWDLGIVVVAEPHSAAEALWHGVDPSHPLHDHPSAEPARRGFLDTYEAVDRLVAELIESTAPDVVVVFSMGGMGPNNSDAPSMVLLPELMSRWALGERMLAVPAEWAAAPAQPPDPGGDRADWDRTWWPQLTDDSSVPIRQRTVDAIPGPAGRWMRQRRAARRALSQPIGFQSLAWHTATWYQPRWHRMRAFALPSFYDGRIRVNLRGREAAGLVDPDDYDAVCDELEALVRSCTDPRTGDRVVESVDRPGRRNPLALGRDAADLVVVWKGGALAFQHAEHGLVGPVPYRRTGGHTGPHGFALLSGGDIIAGEYGVRSAFDVAPTIVELLGETPVEGMSGTSMLDHIRGATALA